MPRPRVRLYEARGSWTLDRWRKLVQHAWAAERPDGRRLACLVNGHGTRFLAVALETNVGGLTDVLDDHSHKVIGEYRDLRKAKNAAERFARAWQKHAPATAVPACECDEMPASAPKRKAARPDRRAPSRARSDS